MSWQVVTSVSLLLSHCVLGAREGYAPQGGRINRNLDPPTNICDTIMNSGVPIRCRCDIDDEALAGELECFVLDSMRENDSIWNVFESQENAEELKIMVRTEGFLSFVPKQVLSLLNELKTLELLNTNITVLSSLTFSNHQQLKKIILNNSVSFLEESAFSKLPELTDIDLSDNVLREVNRNVFHDLPMLERLDLSRNRITIIHDFAFEKIPSMHSLNLSRNNLTVLTPEIFKGLSALGNLDLFDNQITHIGPETFKSLGDLTYLDLSSNLIENIDVRAFEGLDNIEILRLKNNRLTSLPEGVFGATSKLSHLDISRNSLTTMSESLFGSILANFREPRALLRFSENPLVCSCGLTFLLDLKSTTKSNNLSDHIERALCNQDTSVLPLKTYSFSQFCEETTSSVTTTTTTTTPETTRRPTRRRTPPKVLIPKEEKITSGIYEPEPDTEPPKNIFSSVNASSTTVSQPSVPSGPENHPSDQLDRPTVRPPLPTVKPRHLEHTAKSGASVPLKSGLILPIVLIAKVLL